MRTVSLDFETYYDRKIKYSLSTLSPEQYVRDDRFEPHILTWVENHGALNRVMGEVDIRHALKELELHRKDTQTFAHNMRFDGSVASFYFGTRIHKPICSIALMRYHGISRFNRESLAAAAEFFGLELKKGDYLNQVEGLHLYEMSTEQKQNYLQYGGDDTLILDQIVQRMLPVPDYILDFISMTLKMYIEPMMTVNKPLLEEYDKVLVARQEKARDELARLFDFPDTATFLKAIRSKNKFRAMLEEYMPAEEIPMKLSTKATKTARDKAKAADPDVDFSKIKVFTEAFAKDDIAFQELLEHENENVRLLVQTKMENTSSINQSRARRFINLAERGRLVVPLEIYHAISGRYAGGGSEESISDKINLQNLSKRNGDTTLRESMEAPPDFLVIAGDSSQVECRTGAYMAQERSLLDAFERKEDVYCHMAESIYHIPSDEIEYFAKGEGRTSDRHKQYNFMRNVGKVAELQCLYYSGGPKFSRTLKQNGIFIMPDEPEKYNKQQRNTFHDSESDRIVKVYRNKRTQIRRFWWRLGEVLEEMVQGGSGYIGGPNNDMFHYEGAGNVFGHRVPTITFPNGYKIVYPNLRKEYVWDENFQKMAWVFLYDAKSTRGKMYPVTIHGGKLMNNLNQGIAFALLGWQATQIEKEGLPIKGNVHDEWFGLVHKSIADDAVKVYEYWLRQTPEWLKGCPLDCEVGYGPNYASV